MTRDTRSCRFRVFRTCRHPDHHVYLVEESPGLFITYRFLGYSVDFICVAVRLVFFWIRMPSPRLACLPSKLNRVMICPSSILPSYYSSSAFLSLPSSRRLYHSLLSLVGFVFHCGPRCFLHSKLLPSLILSSTENKTSTSRLPRANHFNLKFLGQPSRSPTKTLRTDSFRELAHLDTNSASPYLFRGRTCFGANRSFPQACLSIY